jgi:hypothetical protein
MHAADQMEKPCCRDALSCICNNICFGLRGEKRGKGSRSATGAKPIGSSAGEVDLAGAFRLHDRGGIDSIYIPRVLTAFEPGRGSPRHQFLANTRKPLTARPPSQSFSPGSTLSLPIGIYKCVRSRLKKSSRAERCRALRPDRPRPLRDRLSWSAPSARGRGAWMQSTLGGSLTPWNRSFPMAIYIRG